jgi:hypothetical protein
MHNPFAGLSDIHRRGIRATLVFVDESLCRIEQWANGCEMNSELYRETNTLSDQQRALLIEELAGMRRVIADLRDALELEVEHKNVAAAVHGLSCSLWPHLVELRGKHLQRYGDIPIEVVDELTPRVDELIRRIRNIADIARGHIPSDGE